MKKLNVDEMRSKMFDSGDSDEYSLQDHPQKKVSLRDDIKASLIKTRYPIRNVRVADIIENSPGQTRQVNLDPEKYDEDRSLIESIQQNGVVVPVMVQELPNDSDDIMAATKYRMVYGHRRTAAARFLGIEAVLASVAPKEVDVDLVTYIENVGIRSLIPYEQGLFFEKYLNEHNLTQIAFAEKTGLNRSSVTQIMRAMKAIRDYPQLGAMFKSGMSAITMLNLRDIFAAVPSEQHDELAVLVSDLRTSEITSLKEVTTNGINPLVYLRSSAVITPEKLPFSDTGYNRSDESSAAEDLYEEEHREDVSARSEARSREEFQDTLFHWEEFEKNDEAVQKYARTYVLPETKIRSLISHCREAAAPAECFQPLLLFAKHGGDVSSDTIIELGTLMASDEARKLITRQITVYEKYEKQLETGRKDCEKLSESIHPDAAKILKKVIGLEENNE